MGFGAGAGAGLTGGSVNLESEINELEDPPADVEDNPLKYLDKEGNYDNDVDRKFAYIMGKALGKQDYYNFSLSELFAELESIDVKMADT